MNKKRLISFLLAFLFILNTGIFVFADIGYGLSMSLDILADKSRIKKCGVKNTVLSFEKSDFDRMLGTGEYVTVNTLPEKALGALFLGDKKITAGQTLTRTAASKMRFEPKTNVTGQADFTFSDPANAGKYGVMSIYILEEINLSPIIKEISFDTEKNISYKGYFEAHDPEGDEISFYVANSPRHGTLQLLDEKNGFFMYTPKTDFTGRDTFKIRVKDCYGNRSETVRIIVHINEKMSDTVFSDMTNHWAHTDAAKICDARLISPVSVDGKLHFLPEKTISRGDFLAIAMISAGLEAKVERVSKTSFYDDSDIPINIKSYAEAAKTLGIINGYEENNKILFKSSLPITREEASVIISRILSVCGSFDSDPYLAGILVGVGKGEKAQDSFVTRAQTARIYSNMTDYFESESFFTFSSSAVTYAE